MTVGTVGVPVVPSDVGQKPIDCEIVGGAYRQQVNAHGHYDDVITGLETPVNGAIGAPFSMDYMTAIAKGLIPGAYSFNSYGERTTAGAETNFPVWPDGAFNIPASTGVQMSFVSTSAADSSAGANIRTIEMHYLDVNLVEQVETIILNGLTPVLSVATDVRFIQCLHILTFGTNAFAAGIITASNAGVTYSQIIANDLRCSSAFRMVPAGKVLYIDAMFGSSISGAAAARTILKFVSNTTDNNVFSNPLILLPLSSIGIQDGAALLTMPPQNGFPAGAIVGFTHTTDKAATISASWFGHMENA
jgi:hypothetical protein